MKKFKEPDYKKLAWKEFSKYIRLRDCLESTGSFEQGICFTCGKFYPFNKLQAGHFVPGRGNAVLFDEVGCRAQCVQCNIFKHGEQLLYRQHLVNLYGEEVVKFLEAKRHMVVQRKKSDYILIRKHYENEARKLQAFS